MFGGQNQDPGALLKQAQKMQKDITRLKDDLGERVVEGKAGGDKVIVAVSGNREIVSVKINKEVVDPDDVELLEDLVIAAVNQGLKLAEEMAEKEMSKITGGINLPGLF